jgi:hypothetical protein
VLPGETEWSGYFRRRWGCAYRCCTGASFKHPDVGRSRSRFSLGRCTCAESGRRSETLSASAPPEVLSPSKARVCHGKTPAWPNQHETNSEAHLNCAPRASMTVRTAKQAFCRGRKCGLGLNVQAALSRNTPLPSNAPLSGAGVRSTEASTPTAG